MFKFISSLLLATFVTQFAWAENDSANLKSEVQSKPNILWLSCEDISPHFGCYGDQQAITPNVDQLATEGVRYSNTYTTAGVCAPCRSAIITGVYQSTLGTHHMRCNAKLPKFVAPFTTYLRQSGYYCTNNSKTDYQFKAPKDSWDVSSRKAHWKKRPDKSKPFFAVFNFTGCHESGIENESKYKSVTEDLPARFRQDPKSLILPPYYPDTPIVREDWKRNYELISAADVWAGELIQELKDEGEYENTIIFFWSDHGVGLPRAKRWLYDSGTRIPLIVRIPEKFRKGDQGKPGAINDELVSSLDFAPTVLNLIKAELPKHLQGRAFLGDDLTQPRDYVFGARDRMDERYDIIRAVRDKQFRYIRNYEPFKPYYQYMNTPEKGATMMELRRVHAEGKLPAAAATFMADQKPAEELYDLKSDPHEINNLAAESKYKDVLDRMRARHLEWVVETRDIGLIPESEIEIREKDAGARYNILLNADPDLIQRIRDVSSLAIGGPEGGEELVACLDDKDAIVRYWAAIGLGNLVGKTLPAAVDPTAVKSKLESLCKDNSPCVRIASARALLKQDAPELALPVLKQELQGDHQWARLRAAIVLDESEDQARPLIPELKACLDGQPNKYITRVANRALNELLGTDNKVK